MTIDTTYLDAGTDSIKLARPAILAMAEAINALDLSGYTADDVSYTPGGAGAVATNVQAALRGQVSVKDFGAVGDGVTDDTSSINAAVVYASSLGQTLNVPAGNYKLVPATSKTDEAGTNVCAIEMFSNLHIVADQGAVFKIADNYSTDASPKRHSMFFSNQALNNISFDGLVMDMNGQNNKISPSRPASYSGFTNAQIIFSGPPGGSAARADNVRVSHCQFINNAGVSCIVTHQSNTVGSALSNDWIIENCLFSEVGLDSSDHSSIYGSVINLKVIGCTFKNALPFNSTTHIGGLVACELHCSKSLFIGNEITNYFQAVWVTANFTESLSSGYIIANNKAKISGTFIDFWSHNVLPYGNPEGVIQNVNITGNMIEITSDAAAVAIKSFLKLGARLQPSIVNFSDNVCRSYDSAKETVLCLAVVGTNQLNKADQITIRNNICAGVTNGLVCYFNGDGATATTKNFGKITFENNELGVLVASTLAGYPSSDIYLYGPSAGVVEGLRLSGLQTPDAPIVKDVAAGGRATVYGKAVVPIQVTWTGVTIGNGTLQSRIAIDTDAQFADVMASCVAGGTTTFSGAVYPNFAGLAADGKGAGIMVHSKTGSAEVVPAFIDATATFLSTLNSSGSSFSSAQTINGVSRIVASARFPARKAVI